MKPLTLQAKVNRILAATFATVVLAIALVVFAYAQVRESWSKSQAEESLKRTVHAQIESLIPSFLLREQREGIPLILENIKSREVLASATVESDLEKIHREFPMCTVQESVNACGVGNRTIVIAPIFESGRTLGYLVKVKDRDSIESSHLVSVVEIVVIILMVTFLIIFSVLARLMSKEVPGALDDLLNWVEADLNDKKGTVPNLRLKEFEDLRNGIAEILDRYERTRDQAVIGQLTSGIMHDIKTPLSSIVTATMLAAEQSHDSPKRQHRLENLLRVCQARLPVVGGIIESTLDGNRDIHVDASCDDLGNTVRGAISMASDLLARRKAEIEFTLSSSIGPTPHDPVQITRVLTNLLKNALEAAAGGVPVLSVHVEDELSFTKIAVDDNGPGIQTPTEKLFRVFRSTKSHGSGLGLLISRRIVEAHRGSVSVTRSIRYGGARFEVRLPKKAVSAAGAV